MANFNKVILLGNLTRDVELRSSQSGMSIAKFGMAVNRQTTTRDGEKRESTCFVDLTAFGKQAEVLDQYMSKGRPLFVEGRLDFNTWETKEGDKRSKLSVVVENFQFVGGKGESQGGGGGSRRSGAASGGGDGGSEDVDYGDIPF